MARPLLLGSAFFALGCLLVDGEGHRAGAWTLLALAAWLSFVGWWKAGSRGSVVAIAAAAVAAGAAASSVEVLSFQSSAVRRLLSPEPSSPSSEEAELPWRLTGTVRGDAWTRAGRLTVVLDIEAVERRGEAHAVSGRAWVEIAGDSARQQLADGERVALWTRLRPSRAPEGIRDGIDVAAFCKSYRLVQRLPESRGGLARRLVARMRAAVRSTLAESMPAGPERGLVLAMALGDRSEIDDATAEAFRASGTYHVLALSGAQVALVAVLVVGALRLLRTPPWTEAIVTILSITSYALFVGGDIPVMRAVLMAAAVLLGWLPGKLLGTSGSHTGLLLLLLLLPLALPQYVLYYAWTLLLSPTTQLGRVLASRPDLARLVGIVTSTGVLVGWYWPLAALVLAQGWRSIDGRVWEGAALEATRSQVFRHVTLPLFSRTILLAFGVCFVLSLSEFAAFHLAGVKTIGTELAVLYELTGAAAPVARAAWPV